MNSVDCEKIVENIRKDVSKYLDIENANCGKDWFINRVIDHVREDVPKKKKGTKTVTKPLSGDIRYKKSESFNEDDYKNIKEIEEFLDSLDIEYKKVEDGHYMFHHNNPNIRTYEIRYVPGHMYPMTMEKFGIVGVDKDYFYTRSVEAEQNGSFICWVKNFEWQNERQREVLKSLFMYAAKRIKNKFYARDCVVRVVPTREARDFEKTHCFYGKRGASLNLGLYTKKDKHGIPKGTLVMLYTFGKNFFGRDDSIEILRVGTLRFCSVSGGASKLLKHFLCNYPTIKIGKRDIPVKKMKFYSDYDHNIGSSMDTLGFEFVSYSGGGFVNYWVDTGIIKHREPAKHKWVMQQMAEGKVISVPNAGVKTFVLNVDREKYPIKKVEKKTLF